jgi:hypothetical protein
VSSKLGIVVSFVTFGKIDRRPALFEEIRQTISHGRDKQATIEKKIPHFAACFGYQQASVTCSAVGCPVAASVVRFVIRANWIV